MDDKLTVLLIEDNADDRDLYRRCLDKSITTTYDIHEAEDGEIGLQALSRLIPDCVLLDYSLPGRDGVEILKRIRSKNNFVPVIILTGQGNEAVAVSAIKEGAQDYIVKSTITPETLERMIHVAVAHGELQRRVNEQRNTLEIFTYALAHDLREPTNTVHSFVELIQKHESLTERGQGYFAHVEKAAERMRQLIDTVYLFTRLDASEHIEKEPCSLEDLLHEVNEQYRQLIQSQQILVTSDPLPPALTANRMQLLQLLQNLVGNAIRHSGKNAVVHLGAHEHRNHWLLSVSDTGPGIAPEHLEKIFQPFKRMSGSEERGLGLGLAICRKIVESHAGRIWCESTPGQGATFFFTLPKAAAPALAAPVPSAPAKVSAPSGKEKVARMLLVDDNEADLLLSRIMLVERAQMECEVLTARNGQEALDILNRAKKQGDPIDLVLLDINMPIMSGFELLAQLHIAESLEETAVVMCSTSGYEIDKHMARSMGAAGYLTKPPQFEQLKQILDDHSRLTLDHEGDKCTLMRAA